MTATDPGDGGRAATRTVGTDGSAATRSPSGSANPERPSLSAEVLRLGHAVDPVALATVPAALVAVFALPLSVRRDLVLAYTDPTLLTAFAAHFVHLDAAHLVTNLAVYALVVPAVYLLCVLSGRRTEFYVAGVAFVVAFPLALSALDVALVRPRVGYGFSGVNAAFFGFLPIALFGYLPARLGVPVAVRDAPSLFFAGSALVAVVAVPPSTASLSVAAVAVLAATAYVHECYPALAPLYRRLLALPTTYPGYAELAVVGAGAFAAFPLAAFPADPASDGVVVNLYAHLLGYALAFIASYVTFSLVGLDGDRAAFLRSETSFAGAACGAARNVDGRVAVSANEATDE